MAKKPKLDEWHYHEMLDRLHIASMFLDTHLQQHPVAKIESKVGKLVSDAVDKLTEAYQLIGSIEHSKTK